MNLTEHELVNLLEDHLKRKGPEKFFCAWDIDLIHGAISRKPPSTARDRQTRVLYVEGQVRNSVRVCEVKKASVPAFYEKERSTTHLMERTYVNQGEARYKSMILFFVIFEGPEGPRKIVESLRNVTSYEERLVRSFQAACEEEDAWVSPPAVADNLVDSKSTFYDDEFAHLYGEWQRRSEDRS